MEKMRPSSLATGAAWCGGMCKSGHIQPSWISLCSPLVGGFSSSKDSSNFSFQLHTGADRHQLRCVMLGDSGCEGLGMAAQTWKFPLQQKKAVQNHRKFRRCVQPWPCPMAKEPQSKESVLRWRGNVGLSTEEQGEHFQSSLVPGYSCFPHHRG